MATWKQENIMLTKVGEQALANAEAGEGKITITKIIGSSFIQDDIYNVNSQTQISENITFNIIERESLNDNVGTSIHIQTVNKDLTTKFKLNTIVVYATHDSIGSGAFPYMIAKAENADEINTPDITPTTLNYSLTIINTRGGLLNITLTSAGLVPMSTFTKAKQDLEEKIGHDIEAHNTDISSHPAITAMIAKILGATNWQENPVATLKDIKDLIGMGGIVASKLDGINGYVKFANGFIIQWGVTNDNDPGAGGVTFNFPIAFKSTNYIAIASGHESTVNLGGLATWADSNTYVMIDNQDSRFTGKYKVIAMGV